MTDTKENLMDRGFYRVYYDEGSYTQRQFLCETEEEARAHADRLNDEYGISMVEEGIPSEDCLEFWKVDWLDFKPE